MGHSFKVHQLNPARGTKDDITAWINLREAQELLDMRGRINSIMALQCKCAFANLPKVRQEVGAILPDTQCIEFASQALTRAEARTRAAETAQAVVQQWKDNRAAVRGQLESLAALLVPGIVALAMLIVAILSWLNARQRTAEIGILCALGLRQSDITFIFLAKAALTGLAGVVPGLLLGLCAPIAWEGSAFAAVPFHLIVGAIIATPLMTVLASWLPAQAAASQDPAMVLQRDL
jgi:ABC-type lipoprotein release transport system permease subunit